MKIDEYVITMPVPRVNLTSQINNGDVIMLIPFYTGAATFVPPLCDHRTGQVAGEGRKEAKMSPWSFKGGTQDVQTSPWTPWWPWNFEHVQNSHTKVAEEVSRSQIVQKRQGEAHASPWSQNGCTVVGHWSSRKNAYCCEHYVSICDASAFLVPPLCLLWPTNSVH